MRRMHPGLPALFLMICTPGCFDVPPYPYRDGAQLKAEATRISDALEQYIEAWFDGEVSSMLPDSLVPSGHDTCFGNHYRLVRFEDIDPNRQYIIRKAEPINFDSLHHSFPEPNVTYIGDLQMLVPFGAKIVIEGEFPFCRFFSIQLTPPFDTSVYHYGYAGEGEVPIVDCDIDPLPGHVNPFRPGANRADVKRSYRVEFTAAMGNTCDLNRASVPPYRQTGNHRYVSGIVYQGPWGDTAWTRTKRSFGHGRGQWDCGQLWIRYYAPDKGKDWRAGAGLPRYWYELPDGRRFFIEKDISRASAMINRTFSASTALPKEPVVTNGPDMGWYKQFDIMLVGLEAVAQIYGTWNKEQVRALCLGITGRGEDRPKSGGTEAHKTCCAHINYLTRGMSLGFGKIAVLTGRLPTFPDTRDGATTMQPAQMRYWSLTGYDNSRIMEGFSGMPVHSIMDDEVVLDSTHHYIIVLSRPGDRPGNATAANGCTWGEWGPAAEYSWTLRWLSVAPDWEFALSPDEELLRWGETNWSGSRYNPDLIGRNTHSGVLGEYLPKVHYLTKSQFEALGDNPSIDRIPEWQGAGVRRMRRSGSGSESRRTERHLFDALGRKVMDRDPARPQQDAPFVPARSRLRKTIHVER